MVLTELRERLQTDQFSPFRIVMNNGRVIDVRHRELAHLAKFGGVVYVFGGDNPQAVDGPPIACAIHNICTIEPLPQAA